MFPLSRVNINWSFLRVIARSWDPSIHMFWFGNQELCSTFEEHEALLEVHLCIDLVQSRPLVSYPRLLEEIRGLLPGEAKACIQNGELSVINLISKFSNRRNRGDQKSQQCRRNALCICLFARFLIISSNSIVSSLLVDVTKQVSQGKGFVRLVLAETLMGLDVIWLMDKLKVRAAPTYYSSVSYRTRSQLVKMDTIDDCMIECVVEHTEILLGVVLG
ncbi:hypothetical protein ACSBR2_038806 [Camellia fascicularis]